MTEDKATRLAAIRAANRAREEAALLNKLPASYVGPAAGRLDTAAAAALPNEPPAKRQAAKPSSHPDSPRAAALPAPAPSSNAPSLLDAEPAMALSTLLLILAAAIGGAFLAVVALPQWLPGLSLSLLGAEPKAYWYLSRSSAFIAYGLLWLSMLFGLLISNKFARLWPGGPAAFDLHQHSSLLGLAFALFHALILLGDRYIATDLAELLIPFRYGGYEPFAVGLAQIAFYLLLIVGLSFYVKGWTARPPWRALHFASFLLFVGALAHGLLSGSDSATTWAQWLYWGSGGSILLLSFVRLLSALFVPKRVKREARAA